jgi:hypothetical protein
MKAISKLRLWRVAIVHRNGYEAPSILVEAKANDVHDEVRKLNLRLLDFPDKWSYHLLDLKKKFDDKRGKWVTEE